MKRIDLTTEEAALLISAINSFGDGQHPGAELSNLEYFTADYVLEITAKASTKVREEYRKTLNSIREKYITYKVTHSLDVLNAICKIIDPNLICKN